MTNSRETLWTPANIVTCARVVLVAPWLVVAEAGAAGHLTLWWAFIGFVVLSLTDHLDGHLARSRNEVTTFGKFLDPIADKLVVVVALCFLLAHGLIASWVLLIIVAREFLVSGLRMVVAARGVVVAASNLGKWKTATTMVAIAGLLLALVFEGQQPGVITLIFTVLMFVACVLTAWSGIDYVVACWPHIATPASANEAAGITPEAVISRAHDFGVTLGTAESCTGGLVAGALTSVAGSSEVMRGGIVSYATEIKAALLSVSQQIIADKGVVSRECAEAMARGASAALAAEVCVSITGLAGPGGALPGIPVGTVWIGLAVPAGERAERFEFSGDREAVRAQAVEQALRLMYEGIEEASRSRR